MNKKVKTILAVGLSVVLVCSLGAIHWKFGVKAETPTINNPTVTDGVTAWDCIYFGKFYQNADTEEATPIKWRVLSVDGNDAFLMADQGLECLPYNYDIGENTTWETCFLREWLNQDFYRMAFTEEEQSKIKLTTVKNDALKMLNDPSQDQNDTQDKIYLPSINEVLAGVYGGGADNMSGAKEREVKPTAYAIANGAQIVSGGEYDGNGFFWLRSPGPYQQTAACALAPDGSMMVDTAWMDYLTVRPVLHLDITPDESGEQAWRYAGTKDSNGVETPYEEPTTEEPTTEEPTTEEPTTEEPTTEEPTTEETTTVSAEEGIEVNGTQINYQKNGMRTVYTVSDTIEGKNVVERGLIYGVGGYVDAEDLYKGNSSRYVYSCAANEKGTLATHCSAQLPNSTSYAMTLKFAKSNVKEFNAEWYVRAYAILDDGSYTYSDAKSYRIATVADELYQNKEMDSEVGHNYLFEYILSKVYPNYQEIPFSE